MYHVRNVEPPRAWFVVSSVGGSNAAHGIGDIDGDMRPDSCSIGGATLERSALRRVAADARGSAATIGMASV